MDRKDYLKSGQELVLCTTTPNGNPHANVVVSKGFVGEKLLINDCEMKQTLVNLKNNQNVCLVVKNNETYLRIKGRIEIYNQGEYLEIAKKRNKGLSKVKNTILVQVHEVFDLDNLQFIYFAKV